MCLKMLVGLLKDNKFCKLTWLTIESQLAKPILKLGNKYKLFALSGNEN